MPCWTYTFDLPDLPDFQAGGFKAFAANAEIARHVILKGSPFSCVWLDAAVLCLFVTVLFSASIAMFRKSTRHDAIYGKQT